MSDTSKNKREKKPSKIPVSEPYFKDGIFFAKGENITLKANGLWFSDGTEITHEQTVEIFFKSIHFDEDEDAWYLQIGAERMYIEVQDTAYFVKRIEVADKNCTFFLTDGREWKLSDVKVSYSEGTGKFGPKLYLTDGSGSRASFFSHTYYEAMKFVEKKEGKYFFLEEQVNYEAR